jgi:hypothetical protein
MGITSVGHRLTILKSVYDVKKAQDVPIESDHYMPPSRLPPKLARFERVLLIGQPQLPRHKHSRQMRR